LSWRNGALGLVESRENFVVASSLDHGRSGLVTMANLHGHTQSVEPSTAIRLTRRARSVRE
jgi:hypothetical protein